LCTKVPQYFPPLLKIPFTGKEKAFCVLKFDKNNTWTRVQRKLRTTKAENPKKVKISQPQLRFTGSYKKWSARTK